MAERIAYYPGCSLHTSAREYDSSCRAVLQALGLTYGEVPDWNCCGASSAHSAGHTVSRALPLRNLLKAQEIGKELLVPCAACYSILRTTKDFVAGKSSEAAKLCSQVEKVSGTSYKEQVNVVHPLDLFSRPEIMERLKTLYKRSLQGLKLAPYYGCFLVRPENVAFDNPEQPQKMDQLLREMGADVVRWSYKTECCGGGLGITQGQHASPLVERLILEARKAGADAIVTACPLCQANLEGRQTQSMPVFYFTEMLALALGLEECRAWFKSHLVDTSPLLERWEGGSNDDR